jgi:GT2 family glycosyltransferase
VIVVNWNGKADTLACLEAVDAQLRDVPADAGGAVVTVVDNGSTDGSIAAITSRFPSFRFLPLGTNRGFTGGVAAGVTRSAARNVLFLNNDAVPEPEWLAASVRAIDAAPEDVVSIGGRIISMDGATIDFIGGVMTFDGHAFQNGFRMPLGARPEPAAGDELLFACGGNMISRRDALARVGGFDDDYFAYLEDVDFGWRTWLSGGRVLYEPRATVRHHSSATSNRLGNFERGVLFERNALQTALKNYDDEALHDVAGAMFYTYLHRLHHYATTRNSAAAELAREPFAGTHTLPTGRPSLWSRVKRKLRGSTPLASIHDPLTAMQFRAFDWIVRNSARIAEKRAAVQRMRTRSDRELFEKFPLHFVPTYPGDEQLLGGGLFAALRPRLASVDRALSDIMRA